MNFERKSGILLHPTSLPGNYGIGSLGDEAYKFIDFLIVTEQKLWQVFPLGPTGYGDSPYQSFSAFAGNPLLISLDKLKEEELLTEEDLNVDVDLPKDHVDYGKVINFKFPLLEKAFHEFNSSTSHLERNKFDRFCKKNSEWLDNYALFMALKEYFGGKPWTEWDDDIKFRKDSAVDKYKVELSGRIQFQKFVQYTFFKQWYQLKSYANQNCINIIGDMPIFVAFDSADVWANPEIFELDREGNPINVAGVPPDYFSKTGQLWGNPLYDWNKLKDRGYKWWIDRFNAMLDLVDVVRLDHFRGFAAYWAVPYGEDTAVNGEWVEGPGEDFFKTIEDELGELPIIAEDLGVITPDVEKLRDDFEFPGMNILQFAFDSQEDNEYLPHNYSRNSVVYTGTHDNDTILGWYQKASSEVQNYTQEYLNANSNEICWDFLGAAWSSVATFAIAPLQDVLCLDSEARMNTPGQAVGNWQWRYREDMLTDDVVNNLKKLTQLYYR
ncbi:4-alpha-glucanotransferase [Selenihalanaerobacter shriftii]|uniref:4-alpha-glucanotransferase n=1 Tax=Selenihalanaerobacter shriftii TaxID=142842 RepID=A0A1T4K3Q2_9FIRM|nr:4-alpha-glucanotransferase [Selenihalanaerobacter shriftii]SJZ36983.1 4-alpha-glucanotransferase [Selenihalanaerobacter shriftii]